MSALRLRRIQELRDLNTSARGQVKIGMKDLDLLLQEIEYLKKLQTVPSNPLPTK